MCKISHLLKTKGKMDLFQVKYVKIRKKQKMKWNITVAYQRLFMQGTIYYGEKYRKRKENSLKINAKIDLFCK